MKIKDIDLGKHPILLAPMEDVTDPAFRLMCKGFGADMVYTEFVSSDALIRSVSKTEQKLNISDEERPVAIQIYGKDTDTMVEAARIVEQARPDILDINFGCPVKRVAGKGAGAGMLQNIPKMLEITRAVADAVKAVDLFVDNAAVFASKGEMRKLVQGGGVSLNKEKLVAFDQVVTTADLLDDKYLLVQRGKKNYYLIIAK